VFLPAWDGRYYWNYPIYKPDARLGGLEGFRALIKNGHSLGFRFMPMFGTSAANRMLPEFAKIADAATNQIDGDAFNLNWVDWDNDRHNEGWGPYMNLGVDSCRNWLSERIAETIETYHADLFPGHRRRLGK
jgi:glycosidase